jgi:hypothetical protein
MKMASHFARAEVLTFWLVRRSGDITACLMPASAASVQHAVRIHAREALSPPYEAALKHKREWQPGTSLQGK